MMKINEISRSNDFTDTSDDETEPSVGFSHYNDNNDAIFELHLFNEEIRLIQKPNSFRNENERDLGIGSVIWDSSIIFAKFVEYNRDKMFSIDALEGKSVLELGSGCGLAGISLLMRGCRVFFTDLPEVVHQLTSINVTKSYKRLISSSNYHTCQLIEPVILTLDWKQFVMEFNIDSNDYSQKLTTSTSNFTQILESMPFDYILLTDCVFSIESSQDLISTIDLCSGPKTIIICCYEIRDEQVCSYFIQELSKLFNYKQIPERRFHPEYKNKLVTIIQASKKRL